MKKELSPVRKLYILLSGIHSAEYLHEDLLECNIYKSLVGDPEPRFCEWAYNRIHQKSLANDLVKFALRRSYVYELAKDAKIEPNGMDSIELLRKVLAVHGINEPAIPRPVVDGIREMNLFQQNLKYKLDSGQALTIEPPPDVDSATCRRASERFLKLLFMYYSDVDEDDIFSNIWDNDLHGYKSRKNQYENVFECIKKAGDIGTMNPLLRAFSRELESRNMRLAFQRGKSSIWHSTAYKAFDVLNHALNPEFHDKTVPKEKRMEKQLVAICDVLELLKSNLIRYPKVIQFFRKYEDGHATHYDGYLDTGELIHCFEAGEYKLHYPYLYLAATNPSSVDMVCTDVDNLFWTEI